jgi:pimeloyl-ACP methyl ester carboxylesterase
VAGPYRLLPGPAGDLRSYTSSVPPGVAVNSYIVLCHDLPRAKGSASDLAVTLPALADRLTRETTWPVVTGILRGAGESEGDFSAQGWLDDLGAVMEAGIPSHAPRWLVGFGFGGVLALHVAATDERVAGVGLLGTPARLDMLTKNPEAAVERCVRTGVIRTAGYPGSPEAWAKELSILAPLEDVRHLKGRPLLVVHGAEDPETPVEDARALAEAATGHCDLHLVHGAGHWLRADPRVVAILLGWLERRR